MITDRFGVVSANDDALRLFFLSFASSAVHASIVLSGEGSDRDAASGSTQLSSRIDRLWLATLRGSADAIVTTGATVRAEKLRQTEVPLVIASHSGDIEGLRANPRAELFVASRTERHRSWPDHAQHLGDFDSLSDVIDHVAKRWGRVQVEFGLEALVSAYRKGIIQEVFVTSPSESPPTGRFGDLVALCEFDQLTLYRTN